MRGENYIAVLDAATLRGDHAHRRCPTGPGMQIFSPDGKYGYICSSFNPETDGGRRRPDHAGRAPT